MDAARARAGTRAAVAILTLPSIPDGRRRGRPVLYSAPFEPLDDRRPCRRLERAFDGVGPGPEDSRRCAPVHPRPHARRQRRVRPLRGVGRRFYAALVVGSRLRGARPARRGHHLVRGRRLRGVALESGSAAAGGCPRQPNGSGPLAAASRRRRRRGAPRCRRARSRRVRSPVPGVWDAARPTATASSTWEPSSTSGAPTRSPTPVPPMGSGG